MAIEVVPAGVDDVPMVLAILGEASAWLRSRGVLQWPERFPEELLQRSAASQELYVVLDEGERAGTVTLQWLDPMFWGDRADAGFIHRLAVSRVHAGIGKAVVAWAEREVVAHGREYLCLDTLSSNTRLRRYYEELGFKPVGTVSGPDNHPHSAAHGHWEAVLYEKRLAVGALDAK